MSASVPAPQVVARRGRSAAGAEACGESGRLRGGNGAGGAAECQYPEAIISSDILMAFLPWMFAELNRARASWKGSGYSAYAPGIMSPGRSTPGFQGIYFSLSLWFESSF